MKAGPTVSDRDLLASFRAGDSAAFAQLVDRYGPLVLGVCRRALHHEQDAEDAFQATFCLLAEKASDIRQPDSLAAWLVGVARKVAMRAHSQRSRKRETSLASDMECVFDSSLQEQESPLQELARRHELALLDEELCLLPSEQQAALTLVYLEGLSARETAEQLGISPSAVEGRVKRGRKSLRIRLVRRGVVLGAIVAATLRFQHSLKASDMANVFQRAVKAALSDGAGVSSSVSQLLIQETAVMTPKMFTVSAIVVAVTMALTLGGGYAVLAGGANDSAQQNSRRSENVIHAPSEPAEVGEPDDFVVQLRGNQPRDMPGAKRRREETLDFKRRSAREEEIVAALGMETEFEFIETPLRDVAEYMADYHSINIVLVPQGLKEASTERDLPLTMTIQRVSFDSALNLLLKPHSLDYLIEDDVLKITSRQEVLRTHSTHVYQLDHIQTLTSEEVAEVIRKTIANGAWKPEDASPQDKRRSEQQAEPLGAIHPLPGGLVVTHNRHVQKEVVDFLHQLARKEPAIE